MAQDGRGWYGDEKGHREAALKGQAEGANNTPMRRDEDDDDLPEAWMKKAKRELEKELGVKTEVRTYSFYEDLGALALESVEGEANNGEREWIVFPDSETAEKAAVQRVRDDLEDEPEIFVQEWLQNFVEISDTDRRIIAGEEADNQIEGMDDKELVREVGMDEEWNELQVKMDELFESDSEDVEGKLDGLRTKQDELVEKAKDSLRSSKSDQIQDALEDPIKYFVEERGIYSREDLLKQPFIRIDVEKAAQDAVDTDSPAHFLDNYDSVEIDLPSGAVAYGTN